MTTSNGFYSGEQSGPQLVDPRRIYYYDQPAYSKLANQDTNLAWQQSLPSPMQPLVQSSAPNPYSGSSVPKYNAPAAQPLPTSMYFTNSDAPQAQVLGENISYEAIPGEQYAPDTEALPQPGDLVDPYLCGPPWPELPGFMPQTCEDIGATQFQAPVHAQPPPQGGDPGPSTTGQQSQTSGQQKDKNGNKGKTRKQPQKRASPPKKPKKQKDKDPGPSKNASKRKRTRKDETPENPNQACASAQSQGRDPGPSTAASRRDQEAQPVTKKQKKRKEPLKPELTDERFDLKGGRPLLKDVNQDPQEYTVLKEAVILEVLLNDRHLEEISKVMELKNVTHIVLKSYRCEQQKIMQRAEKYNRMFQLSNNSWVQDCLTYNIHRPFVTWHFLGRILSKAFFGDAEALRHVTTCIDSPREFIVFSTQKDPKKFKDVGETLEVILGWSPGRNCEEDIIEAFCQPAETRLISNLEGILSEFINEEGLPKEYKHEELDYDVLKERKQLGYLPTLDETNGSEWRHVEERLGKRGYGGFRQTIKHVERWRFYHLVHFNEYQDRLIPVKNLLGR